MNEIKCKKMCAGKDKPCIHYISNNGEAGFCSLNSEFRCREAMKKLLPSITQSALKTLLQCPWRYYLHYVRGYSLHDNYLPDPIKLGAVWDKWWDTGLYNPLLFDQYELADYQIAKLTAMWNAVGTLGIKIPYMQTQTKIHLPIGNNIVTGWTDFNFGDGIGEMKFSSSPSWYDDKSNIALQAGTYLLANPDWKYIIMYICRVPALRMGGKGKNAGETVEEFTERLHIDIMSRPSYYFIGLNGRKGTFGKKYYRSEFHLSRLMDSFTFAFRMLRYYIDNHYWPKNQLSCHVPTPCFFAEAKRSGVLSGAMYKQEDPKNLDGGLR